jgi:hypothetical protein
MEETLSLPVNSHCLQDKRVLSPQSGHEPWNKVIYTFCERMLLLKGERLCSISSKAQWLVAHCVPMPFCAYGWG